MDQTRVTFNFNLVKLVQLVFNIFSAFLAVAISVVVIAVSFCIAVKVPGATATLEDDQFCSVVKILYRFSLLTVNVSIVQERCPAYPA